MIGDENIGNGFTNPFPGQRLEWVDFKADVPYEVDRPSELTNDQGQATCVTSRIRGMLVDGQELFLSGELHRPVLDIDIPIKVVPSSTPGHFHLFIDHFMEWKDYEKLLWALAAAGIIEEGYVHASVRRGHTSVRLPHVRKPDAPVTEQAPSLEELLNDTHTVLREVRDKLDGSREELIERYGQIY